jgi:hypothetical protein
MTDTLQDRAKVVRHLLREADRPVECGALMDDAAQVIEGLLKENQRLKRQGEYWEYFEPEIAALLDFGQSPIGTNLLGLRDGDKILKGPVTRKL